MSFSRMISVRARLNRVIAAQGERDSVSELFLNPYFQKAVVYLQVLTRNSEREYALSFKFSDEPSSFNKKIIRGGYMQVAVPPAGSNGLSGHTHPMFPFPSETDLRIWSRDPQGTFMIFCEDIIIVVKDMVPGINLLEYRSIREWPEKIRYLKRHAFVRLFKVERKGLKAEFKAVPESVLNGMRRVSLKERKSRVRRYNLKLAQNRSPRENDARLDRLRREIITAENRLVGTMLKAANAKDVSEESRDRLLSRLRLRILEVMLLLRELKGIIISEKLEDRVQKLRALKTAYHARQLAMEAIVFTSRPAKSRIGLLGKLKVILSDVESSI